MAVAYTYLLVHSIQDLFHYINCINIFLYLFNAALKFRLVGYFLFIISIAFHMSFQSKTAAATPLDKCCYQRPVTALLAAIRAPSR